MRSIWTEFTLQLRMDSGSTESLDEIGPSRPGYLHKPIVFTSVKDFLKLVPDILSRLRHSKNSTYKVITKNLPVGGFMVLRGCKKSFMKEKVMTIFCLSCRIQCAHRYLKQASTEVKRCIFSRLNAITSTHISWSWSLTEYLASRPQTT